MSESEKNQDNFNYSQQAEQIEKMEETINAINKSLVASKELLDKLREIRDAARQSNSEAEANNYKPDYTLDEIEDLERRIAKAKESIEKRNMELTDMQRIKLKVEKLDAKLKKLLKRTDGAVN